MLDNKQVSSSTMQYSPREKRIKSSGSGGKFSQQDVDLTDSPLYFAKGFEKIFLTLYVIALPYITGLLFLFFYVAEGKAELFLSLNEDSSFILTWSIGYEILAALTLLWLIKSAISFSRENARRGARKEFRRP